MKLKTKLTLVDYHEPTGASKYALLIEGYVYGYIRSWDDEPDRFISFHSPAISDDYKVHNSIVAAQRYLRKTFATRYTYNEKLICWPDFGGTAVCL